MATSNTAPAGTGGASTLDRWFEISARGSNIGREVRGGLVTFFTMAYIIALNPLIIGTATDINGNLITGMPKSEAAIGDSIAAVAAATCLVAGVMTILMGIVGRYPLGLAAGLGLNALVAFGVAGKFMTWPQAMGLIVWEGVLITLLVLTGFRQAVFRAVPRALRIGIAAGIGLFIAFVGLVDGGVVRKPEGAPPVELGIGGHLMGWPILVFVVGLGLVVLLSARRVRGALLWAILGSTVLAVILESALKIGSMTDATGAVVNPTGWVLNVPSVEQIFALPDLSLIGRVDLFGGFTAANGVGGVVMILLTIFSLLLADFFDTMGTVVAVGAEAGLLDAEGNPPHVTPVLLVDSLAAIAGGLGSVSSNTSYVESAAGVGEGARTGLASVVTGCAFLLAVFFSPLVNIVPSEAATPVLVFVGFLMLAQVAGVDWDDIEDAFPAFLTLAVMPFTYSVTTGIGAGFIAYVALKLVRGRARQIHPLMYLIAVLFVIYFGQGIIAQLVGA